MQKDILEQLKEYSRQDYVPMHMPGAKRNAAMFYMDNPYELDITEIDGFDNLHHARGILKDAAVRSARLFGADETLFLVNGSSAGILSAVCGATKKRDTVIVARNCHRSVYNAIYLNELNPVYIYPEYARYSYGEATDSREADYFAGISPEQVEAALDAHPDASAVILTSPTYEGIVSDIRGIVSAAHRYGAVLIADEAHGAHFCFSSKFPESAVSCGADAVVQSIHKTLPSLTQTALLHLNGNLIDRERIRRYWDMYQTTSPSYILLAGIDRCMTILEQQGKELFGQYLNRLERLRTQLAALKNIRLAEVDDISKIVLVADSATRLYDIMNEKYHIQLEMAAPGYVIAMTSIGDTDDYYKRFADALFELDREWGSAKDSAGSFVRLENVRIQMNPYDAMNMTAETVQLEKAAGRTAGAAVCIYPPGVPVVNAGEMITPGMLSRISKALCCGLDVIGLETLEGDTERKVGIICLK